MIRRYLLSILAFLAAVPAFSQQKDTLYLTTLWKAQAQFAGYYAALEKGFYEEEGVHVGIIHPFSTQPITNRIETNPDSAFMLSMEAALELTDAGLSLVNILQTSMNSALAIFTASGCSPLELENPKVAVWSSGFGGVLKGWAYREHLDYEWIPASSTVNLLVSGAVDASVVMTYNEYFQIRQLGKSEPEGGLYRLREHGYNIQQEGVYMLRDAYQKHKDQADRFARASRRGWEWVSAHPEEALDIVMEYVTRHRIPTNRTIQKMMLEEVLRLQLDPDSGKREFRLRPDMVEDAGRLLMESGSLTREISLEELLP